MVKNGPAPVSNARTAALAVLEGVLDRRLSLDETLDRVPGYPGLPGRERGFARALAATVLRRLGEIDAVVAACLDKPLTPKARAVTNILRLGIAQILFLKTPVHAAVAETVGLTQGRFSPYKSLANAVLRRVARESAGYHPTQDEGLINTPPWLWESWCAAYGEETARAIGRAHLQEAGLDLTVKAEPELWAARLGAELLPSGSLRYRGDVPVAELDGYAEGAWWVQDVAAACPARLCGDVRGQNVIDLCAAPGGKTAQLAAAGAVVTAVDRSAGRMERLTENLRRLHLEARTVVADAVTWRPPTPADVVLLDAPCSGTGTIRRHPDLARIKTPQDVERLVPLQDRLLEAARESLRPGGLLVYCVCSLQPEEGIARITAFVDRHPEFHRIPVQPSEVGGLAEILTPEGDLRSLPCHAPGMDGFYACRLERGF
jgi:16S rRNA (cytosine967-C5)-methyltransferase